MTLFKQLLIGVSLGFLVLLAGIEIIYVVNARTALQEQLTSHAQDTATSLGMVLPASLESGDKVRTQVTITAVFDRGFYQSIRVITLQGETIAEKHLATTPPDVPEWFTSLIKLEAPSAESMITKEWRQLGRVLVSSHPNFAYRQLWKTTLATTLLLAWLYIGCLLLLSLFLKKILRPLGEIEAAAQSICERNFSTKIDVPKTRELRNVVGAMNALSGKIRKIIDDEVAAANYYHAEGHIDSLTQLDNRRSFESQMNSILSKGEDIESGVLFMVQMDNFKELNARNGIETGNALLKSMGATLADIGKKTNGICACANWATFAVATFNLSRQDALALGDGISNGIRKTIASGNYGIDVIFGCGAAFFQKESVNLGSLMAIADLASLQSMHAGNSSPIIIDFKPEAQDSKGSLYWKAMITNALQENRIALLAQPVLDFNERRKLQLEVAGRLINESGELVIASQFVPMAIRHGLAAAVDHKLLERIFHVLNERRDISDQIAINLSIRSIHDWNLMEWMLETLESKPDIARRIVFEFAEFTVAHNLASLEKFAAEVRNLGAEIAIDNFGLHNSALKCLQALRPAYIKLSPSLLVDLHNNHDNQFFISSVTKIARPFEIKTIALDVENDTLLELLQRLGVDGYQGFVTGNPSRIDLP